MSTETHPPGDGRSVHSPAEGQDASARVAPGPARRLSDLPPKDSATRLASQLLEPEDLEFIDALRRAALLDELEGDELLRVATSLGDSSGATRRIDLLETFYDAGGDAKMSDRRRRKDRFFLQRADESITARAVVERLAELAPEVGTLVLERIGSSDDGPLVLRSGPYFAPLMDEWEERLDTDEVDLREIEGARRGAMVTVRGLVQALNVLLEKHGVRERLIAVRGDAERELYLAVCVGEAVELARAGWMEDEDAEDVVELGGW